jgi:hypothetical protein
MIVSTTDPITGHDITNPEGHPFVVEGTGDNAIKIYFDDEASRRAYLDIAVEHPGEDFQVNLDNPVPMGGEPPQPRH